MDIIFVEKLFVIKKEKEKIFLSFSVVV